MSTATISKASGSVDCNYLNLVGSIATGGATFYAGVNSTDGGSNTGWQFVADPATVATLTKASGSFHLPYVVLTHNTATGGAVYLASESTDGGQNTGWAFGPVTLATAASTAAGAGTATGLRTIHATAAASAAGAGTATATSVAIRAATSTPEVT